MAVIAVAARQERPDPSLAVGRQTLGTLIGLAFLVHLLFVVRLNINWDEFWFLSFVHEYARGTLTLPVQTFHVHLFGWLPDTGGHETDQVLVGRSAFLLLFLGTCGCVYRLARRVASVEASLFAVLCTASYSELLFHATSFRSDGLAVCLLMTSLVLVQEPGQRLPALLLAAALIAIALLVTVKAVFFVPTIVLLLFSSRWRRSPAHAAVLETAAFAVACATITFALYSWHRARLSSSGFDHASVVSMLHASANKVFQGNVPFPRFDEFQESVRANLVQWGVLLIALWSVARKWLARQNGTQALPVLALALPAVSVMFYRNAFPYFYAFVMPPALVLCSVGFDELRSGAAAPDGRGAHLAALAVLALGISAGVTGLKHSSDGIAPQRAIVAAVHQVFPDPVPYLDRNGMIASFPKAGFFMSTWGLENYRAGGRPIFAELLRTRRPRFLILNTRTLSLAFRQGRGGGLLAEDIAILRESFVPYWGPIYVAGTRLRLRAGVAASWRVHAGGSYRLQSDGPVAINGSVYAPGAVVAVEPGAAMIGSDVAQEISLRPSEAGNPPEGPPPAVDVYAGFPSSGPSRLRGL